VASDAPPAHCRIATDPGRKGYLPARQGPKRLQRLRGTAALQVGGTHESFAPLIIRLVLVVVLEWRNEPVCVIVRSLRIASDMPLTHASTTRTSTSIQERRGLFWVRHEHLFPAKNRQNRKIYNLLTTRDMLRVFMGSTRHLSWSVKFFCGVTNK